MEVFLAVLAIFILVVFLYPLANDRADKVTEMNSLKEVQGEACDVVKANDSGNALECPKDYEFVEVSYTVPGYEEIGETSFDMEVSERDMEWLQNAEDEGELLDSDFISEKRKRLHKKIIRAIRENMDEESMNPEDGMVKKQLPWGPSYEEYHSEASYNDMALCADDQDIEYTLYIA